MDTQPKFLINTYKDCQNFSCSNADSKKEAINQFLEFLASDHLELTIKKTSYIIYKY